MRRNFGLSFNTAQRAFQRLQYGLSKRPAEPARPVRIRIIYFGREVFFHGENTYTPAAPVCSHVEGRK